MFLLRGRRAGLALSLLVVHAAPAAAFDLAEVKARGTLRVLVMLDSKRPEFYSTKAGMAPGFDSEVLDLFGAFHKVKIETVTVGSWDALIPALNDKKGDLVAGRFTATASRKKLVDFTNEVFPTRIVALNRKPRKLIETLDQLKAEKIGVIKGTSMAEAVAGMGFANVDDSIPAGGYAEALRSGKITVAVWGIESAMALQREDPEIQLGPFLGLHASLAYAVRKSDAELLKALNNYIDNLRKSQTWNRLVVKYFGEAAPEILKKARVE
jgi:polar amino acid transport system substrate-binding protein